jgi:hypothetical protein
MMISKELLDELLSGVDRPEDLLGDKGLMTELKVRLMERMLGAELTTKPFEIGFVQCFFRHRGHSGAIPKNRIRKPLGRTEWTLSSPGIDFIECFARLAKR